MRIFGGGGRRGRRRRLLAGGLVVTLVAALLGAAAYVVDQPGVYDPARIAWKRWRADNRYVFEEVHPRFLRTDPRALITVRSTEAAAARRAALVAAMFGPGGYPASRLPDAVETSADHPGLAGLDGLQRIDRLVVDMGHGVRKPSFLLHPARPNRTLVLYQHGYAGTFLEVKAHLATLLRRGDTVLAMNLLSYDAGTWPGEMEIAGIGWYPVRPHDLPTFFAHPMRFWFEPAVASLNHALAGGAYDRVVMIGFSMGGWTTQLLAAMDPRIERSYSVAGGYPLYLRAGDRNETPPPALYGPMIRAASYLDLYVLAADAPARRQLQIFNRFDRCCYRNAKALLYEPAVREAVAAIGGGSFAVALDESHADHIFSDHAMALILADMAVADAAPR